MATFKQVGNDLFIVPQPGGQDLVEAKQRGIRPMHFLFDCKSVFTKLRLIL